MRLVLVQLWVVKCHAFTSEVFFPGMNFKDKVVCLFVCLRLRVFSFGRLVDFVAVLHGKIYQPGVEAISQGWKPGHSRKPLPVTALVNNWDPGILGP